MMMMVECVAAAVVGGGGGDEAGNFSLSIITTAVLVCHDNG